MKKCKKCSHENPDSRTVCETCFSPLENSSVCNNSTQEFFDNMEKREKRIKAFNIALIPVYIVICTVLMILTLLSKKYSADIAVFYVVALVLCGLYYFSIFHSDTMFKIEHITAIANIDDAKPSDWYSITQKIGAYLGLIFGIVMMAIPYIYTL